MRRIWLCADDYGMAPGVNTAICDLIAKSRLNATSAMAVADGLNSSSANALRDANAKEPRAEIGLHVTLTAPFVPLSQHFRPTEGGAFPSLKSLLLRALARRLDAPSLTREIDAQFARFEQLFGRAPDFVDGHQHVQLFPQISEALLAIAKQRAPKAWVRQGGRPSGTLARNPKGLLVDWLSRRFRNQAAAFGLAFNPAFAGTYVFDPGTDFSRLFPGFLKGLPEDGLIMCHPGFVDGTLERLDPVTQLREREYAFLSGTAFPAVLEEAGVTLWRDHHSAMASP